MLTGDPTIYHRALPHWRLDGATYFVTWRVDRSRGELAFAERDEVAAALRYFNDRRYQLFAYVVMNDHVHVVVEPRHGFDLERLIHSWKSFTAHRVSRSSGRMWQSEYMDRIIRGEMELREKVAYVLENPFRRWPDIAIYPWAWAWGWEPVD